MNVTSVDLSMDALPMRQSSTASIGRIKPELYKQKSVDSEDGNKDPVETCGKLSFALRYDYEEQALEVRSKINSGKATILQLNSAELIA